MTVWAKMCRVSALWLLLLGVSPFTAPFAVCDFWALFSPTSAPAPGEVHEDPLLKVKTSPEPLVTAAGGSTLLSPAHEIIPGRRVGFLPPPHNRPTSHGILRP
jgi:hypothetical protein